MQTTRAMVRGGAPRWDEEPLVWISVALVFGVAVVGPYMLCAADVWSGWFIIRRSHVHTFEVRTQQPARQHAW